MSTDELAPFLLPVPLPLCTCSDLLLPQEVEDYDSDFKPFLESLGMDSVFVQKPFKGHGCLLAWRRSRRV